MQKFRDTFLMALICIATPAMAGSSNHGGDGVRLLFAKARFTAAEMVRGYLPITGVTNQEIDIWLAQHKDALASDIVMSKHELTEEVLPHEAMTALEGASTIMLSLPILRGAFYTHERAAELLIHESVHHLGISDEVFADSVALSVVKSNESRQPLRQIEARIVSVGAPSMVDSSEAMRVGGVSLESEVFVWTARTNGARGQLLDPVSRTWKETAADGQPSRRLEPTMVWSGRELIVWGGHLTDDNFNVTFYADGALYNPSANSWKPISKVGAPSARSAALGVWTGNELLVWGGRSRYALMGVGAIYDPAQDKWRPMNTSGAPWLTEGMTGVWAGDRFVVHGSNKYEVWMYNPTSDEWESSKSDDENDSYTTIVPKGRDAMVWTGSAIFMFGWRSYPRLASGTQPFAALFDPKTKTWTKVGLDTRQSPRAGETSYNAFWDGTRVLLFGANGTGFPMHSFAPLTKQWRIIGFDDRKLPFGSGSVAVWTGESIISLGGMAASAAMYGAMIEP